MATSPAASGTASPGTARSGAAGQFLAALDGSLPVSTRDLDRRAMAHDASHYLLVPEAIGDPRQHASTCAASWRRPPRDGPRSSSARADQPERAGRERRRHAGHPEELPRRRRARRRRPRPCPARGDGAAGQCAAGRARPQARTGPGQRERLHHRRGRRQQLQRHGLRHGIRTPTAHWTRWSWCCPPAPCSTPARTGRGRQLRAHGAGPARGPAPAAATASVPTRSPCRTIAPAVRDEEHHGLRAERLPGLRQPPGGHPGHT